MKLVCDTNIVFSGLIAGGKTQELLLSDRIELYAPEFFFTELDNHREEISEKSNLSEDELGLLLDLLFRDTEVVPKEEFGDELSKAAEHIEETDPDDVPFLALALHLDVDLWSDDTDFDNQDAVKNWKTHELVAHLE